MKPMPMPLNLEGEEVEGENSEEQSVVTQPDNADVPI